jgi:large subunit ribosomal protein L24e
MERLRKGTQREIHNDIRDVQKNMSLIRAPEGIRKKDKDEVKNESMEMEDEEEIVYMPALEMEKKLSAGIMDIDTVKLKN